MSSSFNCFRYFKSLRIYEKLRFLHDHGVCLQVGFVTDTVETDLFSCKDFYVEVIAEKTNGEILEVKAFKSLRRLQPYLPQVDISEVTAILSYRL